MQSAGIMLKGRFYSLAREGERFAALRVGPDGRIAETYPEGAPLPAGLPVRDLLAEGADSGGGAGTVATRAREGRRPVAMVPAFIDSHVHFLPKAAMGALARPLARLEGGRLLPDCLEGVGALLREEAEARPRGLVIGYGLFAGALAERRLPSAAELDAWVPGRPVLVFSLDGHSSAYSSAALRLLRLESLAVEGRLSGEAHEFNMGRVMAYAMRGLGPAALARGIAGAVGEAAAAGLSSLHCLEGFDDAKSDPGVAALALVGPRLPLRLKLWLQYTETWKVERYARLLGNRRAGGCLAWEMDGSVSSRSAAFDRPYRDREGSGSLYRSAEEAYALMRPFFETGYQLSAHAIGPRGIESVLFAVLVAASLVAIGRGGAGAAAEGAAAAAAGGAASAAAALKAPRLLALYGMAMFCFAAFFSVPQAVAGLAGRPRLVPKAVAAGLGVNFGLILVVTALSLLLSKEPTAIATVGWGRALGPWAEAAGTAFVILAMLTSYWSISFALSSMLKERLGLGNFPAWLLATAPTLLLALAGFGGFLDFMRTAGGAIAVLVAVLLVPAYRRCRKARAAAGETAPALLHPFLASPAWDWVAAVAYLLMAVGSSLPIK